MIVLINHTHLSFQSKWIGPINVYYYNGSILRSENCCTSVLIQNSAFKLGTL